jgi:hypothetical protein
VQRAEGEHADEEQEVAEVSGEGDCGRQMVSAVASGPTTNMPWANPGPKAATAAGPAKYSTMPKTVTGTDSSSTQVTTRSRVRSWLASAMPTKNSGM